MDKEIIKKEDRIKGRLFKKIGVKQFLILKSCLDWGVVWTGDVINIYDISRRKSKRALIHLKKLEVYGYLKQSKDDVRFFELTDLGRNFVLLNINMEKSCYCR